MKITLNIGKINVGRFDVFKLKAFQTIPNAGDHFLTVFGSVHFRISMILYLK